MLHLLRGKAAMRPLRRPGPLFVGVWEFRGFGSLGVLGVYGV